MKKHAFSIALTLGIAALLWVAAMVARSHPLVLAMTAAIAAVYGYGALELHRYRQNTRGLQQALQQVPEALSDLSDWLVRVPSPLQSAVRQRIESERSGLPEPALTPYLVGLLVMLGMLGTFLGMVVTLNGAVFALEGASSVQGMRAAFSEPVKGLGLAFGTSVAGVATSAMLGLMSSLARRERAQASHTLDALIGDRLRPFSLAHQRQENFKALPLVVAQLQSLMTQMAHHSEQLAERLLSSQDRFHRESQAVYTELARSVDASLRSSLGQSMQLASESIRPVVQTTLAEMAQQAQALNERMVQNTREQLDALSTQLGSRAQTAAQSWEAALTRQDQGNARMLDALGGTLEQFGQTFEARAQALVDAVSKHWEQQHSQQDQAEQARLLAWTAALQAMASDLQSQWQQSGRDTLARQQQVCDTLAQTAQAITTQVQGQAQQTLADLQRVQDLQDTRDAQRLAAWQAALETLAATLQAQWQASSSLTLAQQQQVCEALEQTAAQIRSDSEQHSRQSLTEITRLLASSEELVRARIATEAEAAAQHSRRSEELAALLRAELSALRTQEAQHGEAAVARLDALQSAVAEHLRTLGTALEAPIARLIETASEAPRAAAEVIGQLRQEISVSVARDNALLDERTRILGTLSTLLEAINHASTAQREVIDRLVASSQATLTQASTQFQNQVAAETGKLGDIAAQVTASAVDVASLGETFAFAVRSFNERNDKLMAHLQGIEAAMAKSMTRSDEQLAYYVAQAREIIDLSISSQKDVLQALQQSQAQGVA